MACCAGSLGPPPRVTLIAIDRGDTPRTVQGVQFVVRECPARDTAIRPPGPKSLSTPWGPAYRRLPIPGDKPTHSGAHSAPSIKRTAGSPWAWSSVELQGHSQERQRVVQQLHAFGAIQGRNGHCTRPNRLPIRDYEDQSRRTPLGHTEAPEAKGHGSNSPRLDLQAPRLPQSR